MKTLNKILAGIFLITGLSTLLLGLLDVANSDTSKEDKEGALAAIALFSLPSISIATLLIWNLRQQHQQGLKQLNLEKEQVFLQLLQ